MPGDIRRSLTGELGDEVSERLSRLGYEGTVAQALSEWAGVENYEMRLTDDGIDARVLAAPPRHPGLSSDSRGAGTPKAPGPSNSSVARASPC